jgi:membrane protease YdiL (CAAX protease family)
LTSKWKSPELVFTAWTLLALIILLPITQLLKGSFPIFTVVWIIIPLIVVWQTKDASKIGFRAISWSELTRITVINLGGLLILMLLFEPWSHTYEKLLELVLSSQAPDTTFAWLLRFPRLPALAAMTLYSAFVTLFGEELFFRGWLLQLLHRKVGAFWAVVLQAIIFVVPNLLVALVLPSIQGILYVLIYTWLAIGILGGWAASRTGSIWPSLISATLCNLVLVAIIL